MYVINRSQNSLNEGSVKTKSKDLVMTNLHCLLQVRKAFTFQNSLKNTTVSIFMLRLHKK